MNKRQILGDHDVQSRKRHKRVQQPQIGGEHQLSKCDQQDVAPHLGHRSITVHDASTKPLNEKFHLGSFHADGKSKVPSTLPPLPPLSPGPLSKAPFIHRSSTSHYNRSISVSQSDDVLCYERLEFLGDAYVEVVATRLLFDRFPQLPVGRQSQLRELLVKNETLSEFSRQYGFQHKIEAENMSAMIAHSKNGGNKGFNKVLADVLEAYVAAVVLSDPEKGFETVGKWLTALWDPILADYTKSDISYRVTNAAEGDTILDPSKTYNPNAKADLQKRLGGDRTTQLIYESYKDSIELKGDQIGQNRHFIALYLTGCGYERKLLGKGEGNNKVEAGNWAAIEAMHGKEKHIVDQCAEAIRQKKADRMVARSAPSKA